MDSQEDRLEYIKLSKRNINALVYMKDYRRSIMLLIMVLERLDENEKKEFIDYYVDKILHSKLFANGGGYSLDEP